MTFVVDIGNTNIVCGVFSGQELIWSTRFKSDRFSTSHEYYALLISLKDSVWDFHLVDRIAIASVVPDLTRMWQHLFQMYFTAEIYVINGYSDIGLTYVVDDPGFIGADLIVNALAAWKKYNQSCIIVDFGTATTVQLVTSTGKFMGAIISPGLRTASQQLFEKAALLSEIELTKPPTLLGTSTRDAMLSGIVHGHALMIDSFVEEIKYNYKDYEPFAVIATGGMAEFISSLAKTEYKIDRTLTLDGLYLAATILEKNNK
jgi:type III pantothenate kinase